HTTVKEWRGFRQHKPGQPWRYQPQNAQPDRLLGFQLVPWTLSIEKQIGKAVSGVAQNNASIAWEFSQRRDAGIAM
ncbi:DUF3363 domain-containing protein, partial [Novacetimonas maltaceti]